MAARKKTATRRKATRKTSARRSPLARLEAELPETLREFTSDVRTRLNRLEKQVEKASVPYRRQAARLLRDASHRLGRLQVRGEGGWRKLATSSRRDLQQLLRRLEKAVAPPARARKTGTRKKTTARKKAASTRAASARPEPTAAPSRPVIEGVPLRREPAAPPSTPPPAGH